MNRLAALSLVILAAAGFLTVTAAARHHHRPPTTPTSTTAPTSTVSTTTPTTTTVPTTTTIPVSGYPLHTNIVSTTFWVGEIFNANVSDGSQDCSTYDAEWAYHWSGGADVGTDPSTSCEGSIIGGCDGVPSGTGKTFQCATQARTAANSYYPTAPGVTPRENPFYLDLPFDDINNNAAYKSRCSVVPWAAEYPASDCTNQGFSYMKNQWVMITGPNGNTCYGQIEDAGPGDYDDTGYVFGANNARPTNKKYSGDPTQGDGMDVSPALNGCLGFKALDGDDDHVSWQFIAAANVPSGPWTKLVTTSPVDENLNP